MDKPEGKQEQKIIEPAKRVEELLSKLKLRIDPKKTSDLKELQGILDIDFLEREQQLSKASRSFLANKPFLFMLQQSNQIIHAASINTNMIYYLLDYLETRLTNLENIVQGLTKLDLSNMEERIQKLQDTIKQPELTEVANFIREVNKRIENAKQAQNHYVQ